MTAQRSVIPLVAAVLGLSSIQTFAQAKAPIARFVVDARGTSAGLPTEPGWTPVVPTNTQLPSRAIGLDLGAHVYPIRFKSAALGIGVTWGLARARTTPPELPPGTTPPVVQAAEVTTKTSSLAPQLSLNFGHSLGWSYLSAGLGRMRVESEARAVTGTIQSVPRDSGWTKSLNFGGGARWFVNDHLGVSFDLRWHKLSIVPASNTHPGAPRASLITAAVGVALK
jgi:hypothetical protein